MAVRFMRKGVTRYFLVPVIADDDTPTVAEINAGVELTKQVFETNGFNFANSPIQTPDMASRFTSQIPGEDAAADSNLRCYELKGGTDPIRTIQVKDTVARLVIFFQGTAAPAVAAADKCDVWPVIVASRSRSYSAGNEAASYQVNYSITDPPSEDAAVAA